MAVFTWPMRVYWEDTDAGGVVYYANYLKFMERARSEWLRALGFDQNRLREEQGIVFVVRQATIDYLKPARLDDLLMISVALKQAGGARLLMSQSIDREEALGTAEIILASINARTFKPVRIPQELLEILQE
jgi:acyl-CoA thioester hydrolase